MGKIDFGKAYNREEFQLFLREFLTDDYRIEEENISSQINFVSQYSKSIYLLGKTNDFPVYEIEHESEKDPRVSLTRESFKLLAGFGENKALCIFKNKTSDNYRFSLVEIDLDIVDGKKTKNFSNPRRYSFYLGKDAKVHTPSQYLEKKVKDYEDLKKRFSIEVVNKEFYKEIANLFNNLVGGERKDGKDTVKEEGVLKLPSTPDHQKRQEFGVRLIGRMIFVWFLVKKRLVPSRLFDTKIIDEGNYYHKVVEPLFFHVLNTEIDKRIINDMFMKIEVKKLLEGIPFLNGGLFEPHKDDFYEAGVNYRSKHENTLIIPNNWFNDLFKLFNTYNFTVDENSSVDIELSIDPEMLGRIFENLLAEINPESGETARKSSGSYYTPREIVEFMVNESLKYYLLDKTGIKEEKIIKLLKYENEEVEHEITEEEKDKILDALENIKVLDPACGSGAFPIGMLQKITLILQKIDKNSEKWFERQLKHIPDVGVRKMMLKEAQKNKKNPDYMHKKGILRNSIFGLDIQEIAIEISKLRCFLTLIVDEELKEGLENKGIEALPNLEFKFICADSLIKLSENEKEWPHLMTHHIIEKLKEQVDNYFSSYGAEKEILKKEISKTQDELYEAHSEWKGKSAKSGDLEQQLSSWKPFTGEKANWFDPKLMFGFEDGFNVVIGNPPYIQLQKDGGKLGTKYKDQKYSTFEKTGDIYTLFYERGISLLTDNGYLCFITSNKWMRAGYGESLREYFTKMNPKLLVDLGPGVFENATVDTNIIIVQKHANANEMKGITLKSSDEGLSLEKNIKEKAEIIPIQGKTSWFIGSSAEYRLKEKIERIGKPLKEWDVKINYGIKTGLNEAFIIDTPTRDRLVAEDPKSAEILKPILRGRDIKRYSYNWAGLWLINTGFDLNIPKEYPAIFKHLKRFEEKAKKRDDQGQNWWNLRACAYYEEFEKEKIVYPNMTKYLPFLYDDEKFYTNQKCFIITGEVPLKYITGYLNSKIAQYWIKNNCPELQGGTRELSKIFIENLPIPDIANSIVNSVEKIVASVDDVLRIKKSNSKSDKYELEREIQICLYELYELTKKEIEIIEE